MTEFLQQWFTSLSAIEQFFWSIALVASAIFLLQAIMTLVGMDADYDFDFVDGDTMDAGGAMSLFSIRSIVNFFLGFGWGGVTMIGKTDSTFLIYLVTILAGCLFAYCYLYMRRKLKGLESNGMLNLSECVGMKGNTYLRIPGNRKGKGKIQISVNGSIHEFDAVTDGSEIPTGSNIRIVAIEGNSMLVEML